MTRVTVVFALAGLLVSGVLFGMAPSWSEAAPSLGDTIIGVDPDPAGNTATLLGSREGCIAVGQGESFQIDVTVENVSELLAWEAYLSFDPQLLAITERDVQQFLAVLPESDVFDISESVPDGDGHYRIGAANISSPPAGGSGSGVLARLTVLAREPGVSSLSLGPIETKVGTVEPTLTAVDGSRIGDRDDDGFFEGPMEGAQVAIERGCPGAQGASLIFGGSNNLPWWALLAAAVGAVIAIGFGGLVLARRRGVWE